MKLNLTIKLLVGALAVSAAGSALANTSIADGGTGNGSVFLNVWDSTSQTSFTYDLSVSNASDHIQNFTGTGSQSFDLSTDANWTTFQASVHAGDSVQYNLIAADTVATQQAALITSNATKGTGAGQVGGMTNTQLKNNNVNTFIAGVNGSTSSTNNSLFVTNTGPNANAAAYFGSSFTLAAGWPNTLADVGTALNFYKISLNPANNTNNLNKALVTTYAGSWLLSGASLTYSVATSPVPLPMPLTLLLSGLALMGIIARRGKSNDGDVSLSGAAA
jgi:hypothetical protein